MNPSTGVELAGSKPVLWAKPINSRERDTRNPANGPAADTSHKEGLFRIRDLKGVIAPNVPICEAF
jgi:hypothetical protein